MPQTRRSLLAILGSILPVGLTHQGATASAITPDGPQLRFRSFEEAVRNAFEQSPAGSHQIEVGHSERIQSGVQGCHNDRPFAGFAAGRLRIVRAISEPGPVWQGVRLYVARVEVARNDGFATDSPTRPLDFALLPAAPTLI